jgi:tetratricopeptide (TPR) repeat protein
MIGRPDIRDAVLDDPIRQGLVDYRAGRLDAARAAALAAWEARGDVRAAALLALIESDRGEPELALAWTREALAREPANARLHLQLGRLHRAAGCLPAAIEALAAATRLDANLASAWLELGECMARAADAGGALHAFARAARFETTLDAAMQRFVDAVPLDAESVLAAREHVVEEPLSIVICSVDGQRFARAAASYATALGAWPHEVVRIDDARSLADGYARGLERARGPLVAFSHDDVEIATQDLGPRLAGHLRHCDVLGIAGATKLRGPAWSHAGHPFLHGLVVYPEGAGLQVNLYSALGPRVGGMVLLDGVFLAARRDVARAIGWRGADLPGFHGYDVDFSLRAGARGLRLAVAADLGLVHRSRGSYDAAWRAAAAALQARHPALRGPVSARTHSFARTLRDAATVRAFIAGLERFWAEAA